MNYQRFVVFVVSLLTIIAIGVTVYYFMKDEEYIELQTHEIYVNVGDSFKLNYVHNNPLDSTKIDWVIKNTDLVEYDAESNSFKAIKAGETEVWLDTNKSGWREQQCFIKIGDGSQENPFIISNGEQLKDGLENLAENADENSHYILVNDIDLSNIDNFTPLFSNKSFSGEFDGRGYTISNLTINAENSLENAGLFAKVACDGYIHNLILENVKIDGQVVNAGAVAGQNNGLIENVRVNTVNINSSNTGATEIRLGAIAGQTNAIIDVANYVTSYDLIGRIDRCEVVGANLSTNNSTALIGGLTATLIGGVIINSSFNGNIVASSDGVTGAGIVVELKATKQSNAKLKDNYTVVKFDNVTNKAGIVYTNDFSAYTNDSNEIISENIIWGQYFDKEVCADDSVVALVNNGYEYEETFNKRIADQILVARGATTNDIKLGLKKGYVFERNEEDGTSASQYTGMLSHVLYAGNAGIEAFNYDFSIVWQQYDNVNNGYPTLQMMGKSADGFIKINGEEKPVDPVDPEDPETIYDKLTDCKEGETIKLSEDYDYNNAVWETIGTFNGILDGNGYTIKNIKISAKDLSNIGLFGVLGKSAVIKNVTFENITIETSDIIFTTSNPNTLNIGIIAGTNEGIIGDDVKIANNNKIDVEINKNLNVGSVVGVNNKSINNTQNSASIYAKSSSYINMGGIAGINNSAIQETTSVGAITSDANEHNVGGIAGVNSSNISRCAYNGTITVINGNNYVGGIAGTNSGEIRLSSTQGTINGNKVGGLVGYNTGVINQNNAFNLYIQGNELGGLVSNMNSGEMTNCSAVATLNGTSNKGGMVTYIGSAKVHTCFVAITFQGSGTNYAETATEIRKHLVWGIENISQNCAIYNCIYDDDIDGDANKQGRPTTSGIFGDLGGILNPNKTTGNNNLDGRKSTNDCKNNASTFTSDHRSFSIDTWTYGNGNYPTVNGVKIA